MIFIHNTKDIENTYEVKFTAKELDKIVRIVAVLEKEREEEIKKAIEGSLTTS